MSKTNERQRWYPSELIEIFTYLEDNFDSWYENPRATCIKAIEATRTPRNIGSVHSKVIRMIKAMDNYNRTGERTCDIIWKNSRIYDMVKRLCRKYRERMKKEKEEEEEEQKARKAAKKKKRNVRLETETIVNGNVEIINQEASTSQMDVDPQSPFSIEAIDELYKRKIQEAKREYEQIHNLTGEISRLQSDLKKKIKERNIKIERLKF